MRQRPLRLPLAVALGPALLLAAIAGCGASDDGDVGPIEVTPADGDAPRDTALPGAGTPGAIWVEDAGGQAVGVLVRRGADDAVAGRAHYDQVTVFHPESALFFEVTMADAVVRYPVTTFFSGFACDVPVGVAAGGCDDCLAGFGTALLHGGRWWRVRGGQAATQISAGSTWSTGRASTCVAHSTSSARAFPVDEVAGPTPPTQLTPPLRFAWR